MKDINSLSELKNELKEANKSYLLLYKENSENSNCALKTIEEVSKSFDTINFYKSNVTNVRDIHPEYSVSSVPSLLEFDREQFVNIIKGCNSENYYKALFNDVLFKVELKESGKKQKSVTVYSTPTCTWCNTIKTYFRQNRIQFTDIDVSKNQKAAEEIVRKSGQQGVPQTDIEGTIIVGFDKKRINELLDIKSK